MKKNQLLRFLPCVILVTSAIGQKPVYEDFVGAGHSQGINISTSSSLYKPDREKPAAGISSLNGLGLESRHMEAARFLTQAGFGGKPHEINNLAANLDFEAWIDHQFSVKATSMLNENRIAFQTAKSLESRTRDVSNYNNRTKHFHYAWWQSVMTNPDQLRQRVAMALSEIIVISTNGPINNNGENYATFYDVL
ncbi:MAG: DUF1800 family protein, partial [Cryomorphaceae bacterium]